MEIPYPPLFFHSTGDVILAILDILQILLHLVRAPELWTAYIRPCCPTAMET